MKKYKEIVERLKTNLNSLSKKKKIMLAGSCTALAICLACGVFYLTQAPDETVVNAQEKKVTTVSKKQPSEKQDDKDTSTSKEATKKTEDAKKTDNKKKTEDTKKTDDKKTEDVKKTEDAKKTSSSTKEPSKPNASKPAPSKPNASKPNASKPSTPTHTHHWVERTHVVHHEATGHNEQVLVTSAWDETIQVGEPRVWSCCNVCGADITGHEAEHAEAHALAGEGGGHHTEYDFSTVSYQQIHHDAVYETRWVQDSPAWDETVSDGWYCSECGAKR